MDSKKFWESDTFRGLGLASLGLVSRQMGWDMGAATEWFNVGLQVAGLVFAAYGRTKAQTRVTLK